MERENGFESEWQRNVTKIAERNASVGELTYFIDTAYEYAKLYRNRKDVQKLILLGNLFPEEIVRALEIDACFICGGSFEVAKYPGVDLPKDADDVAKSVFGLIGSEDLGLTKSDVLLIPLISDHMRKLKALVSGFVSVICYEVPSDREDPLQMRRFSDEIVRVTKELEKHFCKKLSVRKLKEQTVLSKNASDAFCEFETLYCGKKTVLTASAFLLVANSYRLCRDKQEWTTHLRQLTKELGEKQVECPDDCPEIMLIGTPIYGPNYKLILLIEEMRMGLYHFVHPDIEWIKSAKKTDGGACSVRTLALRNLQADLSPIYVGRSVTEKSVGNALWTGRISGIIAQVMKGQIGYDCEIKRVEKQMENSGIPMTGVETIYDYHDMEQIRVRIEAFSEMLNSRH